MRRILIFVFCLLWLCPTLAVAEEVDSNTLIEQAIAYDGQEVVFTGEGIGDVLNAGDHVWLNLSDGSNAIGVWVDKALTGDIQNVGRYAKHGDTVQIRGFFHRVCPDHGGDLDLHAQSLTLIQRGNTVAHPVAWWKGPLALLLTALAITCVTITFVNMRRRRLPRHES